MEDLENQSLNLLQALSNNGAEFEDQELALEIIEVCLKSIAKKKDELRN